jgi:hypothetical protein
MRNAFSPVMLTMTDLNGLPAISQCKPMNMAQAAINGDKDDIFSPFNLDIKDVEGITFQTFFVINVCDFWLLLI